MTNPQAERDFSDYMRLRYDFTATKDVVKDSPSTALEKAPKDSVLNPASIQTLELRIAKCAIPAPQQEKLAKMLEESKRQDLDKYESGDADAYNALRSLAIAKFKTENPLWKRIVYWKKYRKWKDSIKVEVSPSERTMFLNTLIDMQKEIIQGHDSFVRLPKAVETFAGDYLNLKNEEQTILNRLARYEEIKASGPRRIKELEEAVHQLRNYSSCTPDEQLVLSDKIKAYTGSKAHPNIKVDAIRNIFIDGLNAEASYINSMLEGNDNSKLLDEQHASSLRDQIKMVEEEMRELQRTWFPALKSLEEMGLAYSMGIRFSEATGFTLGMNRMRQNAVELKARFIEDMGKAKDAVRESRQAAESVEKSATEIMKIYAENFDPLTDEFKAQLGDGAKNPAIEDAIEVSAGIEARAHAEKTK